MDGFYEKTAFQAPRSPVSDRLAHICLIALFVFDLSLRRLFHVNEIIAFRSLSDDERTSKFHVELELEVARVKLSKVRRSRRSGIGKLLKISLSTLKQTVSNKVGFIISLF